MEIKGTAVKSINEFVLNNYKDQYKKWFNALSPRSKEIFNTVLSNGWYPLKDAAIEPTIKIGEFFFEGDTKKSAFEGGMYSARVALNGVYKIYVRFSSPGHVVDRGSRILPAYYNPIKISQLVREDKFVKYEMIDCEGIDEVVEYRIAGWMYEALKVSGCKERSVEITESIKTHGRTIFEAKWA